MSRQGSQKSHQAETKQHNTPSCTLPYSPPHRSGQHIELFPSAAANNIGTASNCRSSPFSSETASVRRVVHPQLGSHAHLRFYFIIINKPAVQADLSDHSSFHTTPTSCSVQSNQENSVIVITRQPSRFKDHVPCSFSLQHTFNLVRPCRSSFIHPDLRHIVGKIDPRNSIFISRFYSEQRGQCIISPASCETLAGWEHSSHPVHETTRITHPQLPDNNAIVRPYSITRLTYLSATRLFQFQSCL